MFPDIFLFLLNFSEVYLNHNNEVYSVLKVSVICAFDICMIIAQWENMPQIYQLTTQVIVFLLPKFHLDASFLNIACLWHFVSSWICGMIGCQKADSEPYGTYCNFLNSLWPSDAIWRHRSGSTLAQVTGCCLTAPSHYLNQCWLISKVQWHTSECNFTRDTSAISHWN